MLSRREAQLVFPRIKFLRSDKLIWRSRKQDGPRRVKSVTLYKLDWDDYGKRRQEAYEGRGEGGYVRQGWEAYAQALPAQYEEMVRGLVYAISPEYLREIQRNAERAVEEWGIERGFDTVVREHCLNPSVEHVEVAFYLLTDCIYDPETRYWMDHDRLERCISHEANMFKFWVGQTGDACVWDFAKMSDLSRECAETNATDDVRDFVHETWRFHELRHEPVPEKGRKRTRAAPLGAV
jgi:hypothetical protein